MSSKRKSTIVINADEFASIRKSLQHSIQIQTHDPIELCQSTLDQISMRIQSKNIAGIQSISIHDVGMMYVIMALRIDTKSVKKPKGFESWIGEKCKKVWETFGTTSLTWSTILKIVKKPMFTRWILKRREYYEAKPFEETTGIFLDLIRIYLNSRQIENDVYVANLVLQTAVSFVTPDLTENEMFELCGTISKIGHLEEYAPKCPVDEFDQIGKAIETIIDTRFDVENRHVLAALYLLSVYDRYMKGDDVLETKVIEFAKQIRVYEIDVDSIDLVLRYFNQLDLSQEDVSIIRSNADLQRKVDAQFDFRWVKNRDKYPEIERSLTYNETSNRAAAIQNNVAAWTSNTDMKQYLQDVFLLNMNPSQPKANEFLIETFVRAYYNRLGNMYPNLNEHQLTIFIAAMWVMHSISSTEPYIAFTQALLNRLKHIPRGQILDPAVSRKLFSRAWDPIVFATEYFEKFKQLYIRRPEKEINDAFFLFLGVLEKFVDSGTLLNAVFKGCYEQLTASLRKDETDRFGEVVVEFIGSFDLKRIAEMPGIVGLVRQIEDHPSWDDVVCLTFVGKLYEAKRIKEIESCIVERFKHMDGLISNNFVRENWYTLAVSFVVVFTNPVTYWNYLNVSYRSKDVTIVGNALFKLESRNRDPAFDTYFDDGKHVKLQEIIEWYDRFPDKLYELVACKQKIEEIKKKENTVTRRASAAFGALKSNVVAKGANVMRNTMNMKMLGGIDAYVMVTDGVYHEEDLS